MLANLGNDHRFISKERHEGLCLKWTQYHTIVEIRDS